MATLNKCSNNSTREAKAEQKGFQSHISVMLLVGVRLRPWAWAHAFSMLVLVVTKANRKWPKQCLT